MARTPKDVTGAELAILQVLWERGSMSIQAVSEILYPDDAVKKYSTVKRLLARLESKGYVARVESAALVQFTAARSRDELVGDRLEAIVNTLCHGSVAPLLTHLSTADSLTDQQQRSLRELIEELDRKSKGGKKKC